MADHERNLLAKAIHTEDLMALLDAKVTEDAFADEEHLMILGWMRKHYATYGKSPSAAALRGDHPTYTLPETPEPIEYYIAKVKSRYKYDILATAVSESGILLDEAADADIDDVEKILARAVQDVQTTSSALRDHNLTDPDEFEKLWDLYAKLKENPDEMRGWETGFPTIDRACMGLQAGQLITIVGPPKSGKSTIAEVIADNVQRQGADVLLISFEMSYDEMAARWVGMRAGTNYRRLLKGQMNATDEKRFERVMRQLEKPDVAKLILSEDITSTTTVSGVIAKIQQYQPDLVIIDGVYLMDDENGENKGSSQAITNITRGLKRVMQTFQVPGIITTQALFSKMKGQSVQASSIGYSSSFGQDSDVVIAAESRENAHGEKEHWLKLLLTRSGPLAEVEIDFDWSTSSFIELAGIDLAKDEDPDLEDDGLFKDELFDDEAVSA